MTALVAVLSGPRLMFALSAVLAVGGVLLSANAFAGVPVALPFLGG